MEYLYFCFVCVSFLFFSFQPLADGPNDGKISNAIDLSGNSAADAADAAAADGDDDIRKSKCLAWLRVVTIERTPFFSRRLLSQPVFSFSRKKEAKRVDTVPSTIVCYALKIFTVWNNTVLTMLMFRSKGVIKKIPYLSPSLTLKNRKKKSILALGKTNMNNTQSIIRICS